MTRDTLGIEHVVVLAWRGEHVVCHVWVVESLYEGCYGTEGPNVQFEAGVAGDVRCGYGATRGCGGFDFRKV